LRTFWFSSRRDKKTKEKYHEEISDGIGTLGAHSTRTTPCLTTKQTHLNEESESLLTSAFRGLERTRKQRYFVVSL
jgi:hypothetical protein